MKNYYLSVILGSILVFTACKNESPVINKEETVTNSTLTSLIKYKVLIQDTSIKVFIKKDSLAYKGADVDKVMGENINFLSYKELRGYLANIKKMLNGSDAVLADKTLKLAETPEERKWLYAMCDSIVYEENGKEIRTFECDSMSRIEYIFGLEFYENWKLDEKSGMLNKDVLGYAVLTIDEVKGFKPFYYFFKNKESFEKIKAKIQTE